MTSSSRFPTRAGLARWWAVRRAAPQRTRVAVVVAATVAIAAVALLGLYPTRPYLAQRAATARADQDLDRLGRENRLLAARAAELQTPEEIERVAREEHGMVQRGEEAFAVLPRPAPRVELPEVWPFRGAAAVLNE